MKPNTKAVALGHRLQKCKNVITLGVHTNFSDYNSRDAGLILKAPKIYYPTPFYAGLFNAMGKQTFPSYHTYTCVQDKIKQTALFNMFHIPHPATRVFYGKQLEEKILSRFDFPFIAKIPRGSSMGRGVFLITGHETLSEYLEKTTVAYIQEYIETDRDVRVVVIGKKAVHAYWRIAPAGEFKTNIASGGTISLDPVPQSIIDMALHTASVCRWDDVGIDVLAGKQGNYIIEANIRYGRQGFSAAGIDYIELMEQLIDDGKI